MTRGTAAVAAISILILSSCSPKETAEAPKPAAEASSAPSTGGPHAFVHLKNGKKIGGTIIASSQTDLVVAGDDGIEQKIPLPQVKSVEYADATAEAAPPASGLAREDGSGRKSAPPKRAAREEPAPVLTPAPVGEPSAAPVPPERPVTTRTYELPAGSELSVRTNEAIDSATAQEGQTFDAQVTRDATDAQGDVVVPRGSTASIVIRSASQGGRIKGASDLVLDMHAVRINGKQYTIDTADMTKQGKSGVGANRRTAEYTGGGAALGAIIGAIAGGGKGAAIGAAAGAGAGALTQVLTRGKSIKVPAESVLTFRLDKPLKVVAAE